MLYEVCYCALSSIFAVEATHGRVARVGACLHAPALSPRARSSGFQISPPEDSLVGGPPARWFVITRLVFYAARARRTCAARRGPGSRSGTLWHVSLGRALCCSLGVAGVRAPRGRHFRFYERDKIHLKPGYRRERE